MLFSKNKQQKTRGFKYQPRFWDEEKEEFKGRVAEAKKRYHGEEDEDYQPSGSFSFRSPKATENRGSRFETNYGKVNPSRLIVLIVLLAAIVYFMLFFQY